MFITTVSLLSEFILLVFTLTLWVKDSPIKNANRMLGLDYLLLAILNVWMLCWYHAPGSKVDLLLIYYLPLDHVLKMFIGPVTYFYVLLLFDRSYVLTFRRLFVHALPTLPSLIYLFYFSLLPLSVRVGIITSTSDSRRWMELVLDYLFYIQAIVYLTICMLKVHKQCKSNYLQKEKLYQTNIRWLLYLLGLSVLGLLSHLPLCFISNYDDIETLLGIATIALLIISVFIQSTFTLGLPQQFLVEVHQQTIHQLKLSEMQIADYLQRLSDIMESDKLYLHSHCSLESVSIQTNIPKHHLSFVINLENDSFSDFVNKLRCQHACTLLVGAVKQKLTIEAIGMQSGFGSRVNFINAFKKFYGASPSDYQSDQNV